MTVETTPLKEINLESVILAHNYDALKESAAEVAEALDDVLNTIGDLLIDDDLGLSNSKTTTAKLLGLHEKYGRSADLNESIRFCLDEPERN